MSYSEITMSKEYEYCDMNVINIKEEHEDVDDTAVNTNNPDNISQFNRNTAGDIKNEYFFTEVSNNIASDTSKVKDETSVVCTKMILKKEMLFCDYCCEEYRDYCGKCEMLEHILNGNTYYGEKNGMPKNILEIRNTFGHFGVFTLKIIPQGVKFGPFTGLHPSENLWRVKDGKLLVSDDKMNILNWMQYINSTENTSKQNLLVFQYEDNIYYRTTCEIQEGDELLVHFGDDYNPDMSQNVEIMFNPAIVLVTKDVFACTYCCLGFSSELFLFQHKTICPHKEYESLIIEELVQCASCKIYLERKEYLEYHITCCDGKMKSQTAPPSADLQQARTEGRSAILIEHKARPQVLHKCDLCSYNTLCASDLSAHVNEHYEVKMYGCEICHRRFKTAEAFRLHATNAHVKTEEENPSSADVKSKCMESRVGDEERRFACSKCDYKAKHKRSLEAHEVSKHLAEAQYNCMECGYKAVFESEIKRHIKRKHLKVFCFECTDCAYKTSYKSSLETHVRLKHTNEKEYECTECEYKSSCKSLLKVHVKAKHVTEKDYKCAECSYTTSYKSALITHTMAKHTNERKYKCPDCEYKATCKTHLKSHVKAKHTAEKEYKCTECGYETSYRASFQRHTTAKHLKDGRYMCTECDFVTGCKTVLKTHVKGKHIDEKEYRCEKCHFKTSYKTSLKNHTKAIHLLECDYKCTECTYETGFKASLEKHVKARHLKEKGFKCAECEYETSQKSNLRTHVRAKHFKECDYQCTECDYRTSYKWCLTKHVKIKHLKEYEYKCAECAYATSCESHLEIHMKSKHSPVENDHFLC